MRSLTDEEEETYAACPPSVTFGATSPWRGRIAPTFYSASVRRTVAVAASSGSASIVSPSDASTAAASASRP